MAQKPATGRPFGTGTSGNPAGRPKGIGRLVRETVGDDMTKIVKAQVAIALGNKPIGYEGPPPKPSEITKAAEWVRDTGWHKPRQHVEIDGHLEVGTQDLTKLSREELEDWIARADAEADEQDDDVPAAEAAGTAQG